MTAEATRIFVLTEIYTAMVPGAKSPTDAGESLSLCGAVRRLADVSLCPPEALSTQSAGDSLWVVYGPADQLVGWVRVA